VRCIYSQPETGLWQVRMRVGAFDELAQPEIQDLATF
jgi:hypothetical protein